MRILHITHQYPPDDVGGVELHTQTVARELAARGHAVSVFYRRSAEGWGLERRQEGDVTVWAAWSGPIQPTGRFLATFRDEPILQGFRRVLGEARPDVVHVQHLMGLPIAVIEVVQQAHIPFVLTLHDYWWLCANAQLLTNDTEQLCAGPEWWVNCGRCALARAGQGDKRWLAPAIAPLFAYRQQRLQHIAALAARIIVPTRFTEEAYRPLALPANRVTVIPHGIAVPASPPLPPAAEEGRQGLRIAYVGGIARQKGVHVLIEAVNDLPHDGVQLAIFGDEQAYPEYAATLRALATHPGIRFAGRIPNQQVIQTLAQFDVVVVPSIWYETAALVVQEAFAANVPVVASDLGALRERVQHGADGLLVAPDDVSALHDALLELLRDPALRVRLRGGIQPVRTIAEQVNDTEAIYVEVAQAMEKGYPQGTM